jgi:tetrahedral aminopeptidase
MEELLQFAKELISLPGLSAYEKPVREVISAAWEPLVDELQISRLGSLHGLRRGQGKAPRPALMIAAHMDAIGLMVTGIVNGFLRVTEVGGLDPRILPSQPVIVHGRRDLDGVVIKPPDFLLPRNVSGKPALLEHLLVDTGLESDDVAELVRVGDVVSFAQPPIELAGKALAGHTLDNRASVAALTYCLRELQHMVHDWDVWAVATTQEEETLGGAFTSTYDLRPDLAIVVDVTFAKGPGTSDYGTFTLGKGPTIVWGANNHPVIHRKLKDLAEQIDLPYQMEVEPGVGGTDAFATQITAGGVPTQVLGIPLRYMHTPIEMVSVKDMGRMGRWLAEFITRLEIDFMKTVRWDESDNEEQKDES